MRVLLVLATIPLLTACSIFSSSEPPAPLAEISSTETVAGATASTGVPASGTATSSENTTSSGTRAAATTPSTDDTNVALVPTAAGTSMPQSSVLPPPGPAATSLPAPANQPVPASQSAASSQPALAASQPALAPTVAAVPAPVNPTPPPPALTGTDISGKWVGSWIGNGLFNAPRQENLTLELAQRGEVGYGRMVLDGAVAAESVPWEVRQQGLGGTRVFAEINGSKVRLTHEMDDRVFTANMVVNGDQMVGEVKGRRVRLMLTRQYPASAPARDVPQQAAQMAPPPPVMAGQPIQQTPVAMAPQPTEPEPKAAEQSRPRNEEFVKAPELKSLYFDFDKSALRPDAVDALSANATWLKQNVDTFVLIEGNADERGTAEYNLALGDRRARSALDYLEANGIARDRMSTVSYGKERPICVEATEQCHALNRRADFRVKTK